MFRKKIPICLFFLCFTASMFSQNNKPVNVNTDISRTKVFENYVKEGYGTAKIYTELANAYYFKNEYAKAKIWFEKLFDTAKVTDNTLIFRYKQTLKAIEAKKNVASN
jgi:hypothetical protein